MLSYKLKHLCSRVIMSLGAFGLFSISNAGQSEAAELYGTSFTYNVARNSRLYASFTEPTCVVPTDGSVKNLVSTGVYVAGTTGTNPTTGYCEFKCKDGFYFEGAEGYSGRAGSPNDLTITATNSCWGVEPDCVADESKHVASGEAISGEESYSCTWTCENGYSVGGGTSTTLTFTENVTGATGTIQPTKSCAARQYTVTFDCGPNSTYGETNQRTGTGRATYGATFTIPTTKCKAAYGVYPFEGWLKQTNEEVPNGAMGWEHGVI